MKNVLEDECIIDLYTELPYEISRNRLYGDVLNPDIVACPLNNDSRYEENALGS